MSSPLVLSAEKQGVVYYGPTRNPRQDRYWAERGLIHREDTETGDYETLGLREFLQRMDAVSGFNAKLIAKDRVLHADEIERNLRFLERAADLVARAKEQGLPPRMPAGFAREFVGALTGYGQQVGDNKYVF